MPHLSKRKLTQVQEKEIYQQLLDIMVPGYEQKQQHAIGELLTRTEKIMLAKRCAAVALFAKGVSPYRVADVLSLSPSTSARISVRYERGGYAHLRSLLEQQETAKSIFSIIDRFIQTFPKYNGRRWDWLED
jgi:Trp operon repressor